VISGGSILSCCPCNSHEHERALKEKDEGLGLVIHLFVKEPQLKDNEVTFAVFYLHD